MSAGKKSCNLGQQNFLVIVSCFADVFNLAKKSLPCFIAEQNGPCPLFNTHLFAYIYGWSRGVVVKADQYQFILNKLTLTNSARATYGTSLAPSIHSTSSPLCAYAIVTENIVLQRLTWRINLVLIHPSIHIVHIYKYIWETSWKCFIFKKVQSGITKMSQIIFLENRNSLHLPERSTGGKWNTGAKKSGPISPEAKLILRETLHNDIKLYEYVKSKFQAQLKELDGRTLKKKEWPVQKINSRRISQNPPIDIFKKLDQHNLSIHWFLCNWETSIDGYQGSDIVKESGGRAANI